VLRHHQRDQQDAQMFFRVQFGYLRQDEGQFPPTVLLVAQLVLLSIFMVAKAIEGHINALLPNSSAGRKEEKLPECIGTHFEIMGSCIRTGEHFI